MKGEKGIPLVMRQSQKRLIVGLENLVKYISNRINIKESTIVEIGSYQGESTEIFAKHFKKVIAIDPWQNGYDKNDIASYHCSMSIVESAFDERMKKYNNVEKIKNYSHLSVNDFDDESVDIVYIDGDHTFEGCKRDIECWLPKIKKSGFLSGHDYYKSRNHQVTKAVETFGYPDKTFEDTSWVIKI